MNHALRFDTLTRLLVSCVIGTIAAVPVLAQDKASSASSTKGELMVLASQHPLVGVQFPKELAEHAAQIDAAAPMWFGVEDDGSVQPLENCDGPYASYVAQARQHEMKVLPILKNFKPKALLSDPKALARCIEESVALAERENFDGLVLDVEHLDSAGRQPLVDLTAGLHAGLKAKGKMLVVAVASRAWKKEYDYAALAAHSDYLYVMTYDYVGSWSDRVGPTAPWSWEGQSRDIQRDLKIIENLGVPANKMLIGVALYGPDFTLPAAGESKHVGVDVQPVNRLKELAAAQKASLTFDPSMLSSWFDYTAADGKPHRVWFDDATAFRGKIANIKAQHYAGIGVWSIRYADKSVGDDLWQALVK